MSKTKKLAKGQTMSKITKKELLVIVRDHLMKNSGEAFTLKKFFRSLKLTTHPLKMLCVDILNEMLEQGVIARNTDGEFFLANKEKMVDEGVFRRTNRMKNVVETSDGRSIYIYEESTMHALPGDKVRVALLARKRGSTKLVGEVIEIIERSDKQYIGVLDIHNSVAFLISPESYLSTDIIIPKEKLGKATSEDKVVVRVVDWPMNSSNPYGEIVDILGRRGENETEMHAILAEFGLPYSYPKEVETVAEHIEPGITPEEIAQREDFRDVTTFTIDPRDAKDFDDALSIRKLSDGVWEVGVHIADVSHYVLEGGIIDKEAEKRATSVYLVDRTVPMLPERLCNFICSLRPNEEKLTFSVIFEMNEEAEVRNYRIVHTVINSNRRFAYEEVQELLERSGEASEEDYRYSDITPEKGDAASFGEFSEELIILNRLAHKLRAARFKNGAIGFDREEVRFETDEKGRPLSVYFKRSKDANKLIEEFMLLANRTVAESIGKVKKGEKPRTLPYRIHDMPDPNKLENLSQFVSRFGYYVKTEGTKPEVARSLNKLLADVRGQKIQALVENVSLRAMMKARYSTDNIGHYGLAFDYYTHFTSPIRRYPDLMVHRLLTRYARGLKDASRAKYESLCEHSSSMEQLAASAERASIKYKQVEFMSDKIGEEFDATISGVTEFGVYAEIDENKCEGLIPVRSLGDEAFDFDEKNYCLVGGKTHHVFAIGDRILVKVAATNLYRKHIDFEFVKKLSNDTADKSPFYSKFLDFSHSKQKGKKSKKASKKRK